MKLLGRACLVSILALGGCAEHEPPRVQSTPSAARIAGLPPLPFPLGQATPVFQRLFEGVDEALEDPMPEPRTESESTYRRYIENELHDWLDRRGTAIRAAENRARSLASAPDEEKAVGHALVAMLGERTAEAVIEAPVPNESARPERATAIRDAWRERLASLLDGAHAHWTVCSQTLRLASPELAPWKERCDDEVDRGATPRQPN